MGELEDMTEEAEPKRETRFHCKTCRWVGSGSYFNIIVGIAALLVNASYERGYMFG